MPSIVRSESALLEDPDTASSALAARLRLEAAQYDLVAAYKMRQIKAGRTWQAGWMSYRLARA
jgi:hypothetical protein